MLSLAQGVEEKRKDFDERQFQRSFLNLCLLSATWFSNLAGNKVRQKSRQHSLVSESAENPTFLKFYILYAMLDRIPKSECSFFPIMWGQTRH